MPCAFARSTIAFRSPPSALLTYQIHMPLPSKAVPLGGVPVGGDGFFRIHSQRELFVCTPRRPRTYSRPPRASVGTETTMRVELALTGLRARVFPPRTGKITRGFLGKRLPASFTFPPGATVRASVQSLAHLIQLRCGGRERAWLGAVTASRVARTASDVRIARIPGFNNATDLQSRHAGAS